MSKYRSFIYTPRSGSRICVRKDAGPRPNNNFLTVHTLANNSHVVWSRFPQIQLLREKYLARNEARHQLIDALLQQLPDSVIIDDRGGISVIPSGWSEYRDLLALCHAIGVGVQVSTECALQALACGQGVFVQSHDRGGQVMPHPEPPVVDTPDPFPPHPEAEADLRSVPLPVKGLTLSAFAGRMIDAQWCEDGLTRASVEIATEAGWDLAVSPQFNYGEGGTRVFDLPIEVILRSDVAGRQYPAQRAAIFSWACSMAISTPTPIDEDCPL